MNIIEDISRDGKHRWFVTFGNKAPWQTRLAIRYERDERRIDRKAGKL